MSNALAIAGVTAVLRDLLDSGLIDHDVVDAMGQGVAVTAVAPDTIRLEGTDARPQLNIFLYQATPNAAWRNMQLPSRDGNGARMSNPPLALDLHYLVTAYGVTDLQAEVLLGYAMQLLHETPALSRNAIRTALNPPSAPVSGALLPSIYQALRASDLAEQYEQIKITPTPMNTEEMSKLWSALQAHYRPTASYQATVVLIEATRPARAPLPVLTRGPAITSAVDPSKKIETGVVVQATLDSPFPEIDDIELPASQIVAHLGDNVTLKGNNLDGSNHALLLSLPRLGIERSVTPASSADAHAVAFALPNLPVDYPAGTYLIALQVLRPGETTPRSSAQSALRIAPQLTSLTSPPQVFVRDGGGTATIALTCTPQVRPTQRVSLLLGTLEVLSDPRAVTTANLSFTVIKAPVGKHRVRLRVDGVDSEAIDRTQSPPVFFEQRIEIA